MEFLAATFFLIIIERKTGSFHHVLLTEVVCGTDISRSTTIAMDYDNIDKDKVISKVCIRAKWLMRPELISVSVA